MSMLLLEILGLLALCVGVFLWFSLGPALVVGGLAVIVACEVRGDDKSSGET